MTDMQIRDLTTIDEFRQVVALEQAIWGYTDDADLVTRAGVHLHRASRRDAAWRLRAVRAAWSASPTPWSA